MEPKIRFVFYYLYFFQMVLQYSKCYETNQENFVVVLSITNYLASFKVQARVSRRKRVLVVCFVVVQEIKRVSGKCVGYRAAVSAITVN